MRRSTKHPASDAMDRRTLGIALGAATTAMALQGSAKAAASEGTSLITIPVGSRSLSARLRKAETAAPRGLVVAIHGGGYTSKYFDGPGMSSIERLTAAGYHVLALDRPGYGAAKDWLIGFDDQVAVLSEAAEWGRTRFGTPPGNTFLYGHSIGGMLALLLARQSPEKYQGISMTGAGVQFHEPFKKALVDRISQALADTHSLSGEAARKANFMAPPWSCDPKVATFDPERDVPSMLRELKDAASWDERLAKEASQVKVPVQLINGEYDALWQSNPASMKIASEIFSAAPLVDVHVQKFAGHSVELHYVYTSQIARVIAFIEDCRVHRLRPS